MIKRIVFMAAMLATTAIMMVGQAPSPDEQKGIQAIQEAAPKGVDAMAAAVDDFAAKFPNSPRKPAVLSATGDAYESTGNAARAMIYYQSALDADPKHYYSMLMLASEIARGTKEFEIDEAAKTAKLNKAEKYAKDGLALLATAPKPNPAATDEQWNTLKKDDEARAHEALGMIAMLRKKNDVAISEFKQAVQVGVSPQPTAMIRLAGAYTDSAKFTEAMAELDKVIAIPGLPAAYKQVAENEKKRAAQLKAQADGKK